LSAAWPGGIPADVWSSDFARRRHRRRGEPSPSGRGQGEGLDVDSSSAVIGRSQLSFVSEVSADMVTDISPSRTKYLSFDPPKSTVHAASAGRSLAAVKCSVLEKRSGAIGSRQLRANRMGFSAPVPIAAEENVTFDPSPCPLPEGEGSHPRADEVPQRPNSKAGGMPALEPQGTNMVGRCLNDAGVTA
jgi:hypothetical protein